MSLVHFLIDFTQRWLGSLPKLILAFLAALLCVLILATLWEFRSRLTKREMLHELRGTRVGAPLVIITAFVAVVTIGFATPQAMIGDEVTHYYMLVKQAQDISQPNFYADIPMAYGGVETRRYPHSFGWHYFGALAYLITGGSFYGVQLYQAFFLLQLLTVAYLLARSRGGVESRAALLYVLTLASLPLCLLFSVAFYQDVPMTAQVLTAFLLLNKRRWLWASCFMALAVGFKVTAVLFFPAFFLLLLFWEARKGSWKNGLLALSFSAMVALGSTWVLGKVINVYAQAPFYPQEKLEIALTVIKNRLLALSAKVDIEPVSRIVERSTAVASQYMHSPSPETAPTIIANHPGDLRLKENYLIYGGLLLWLAVFAGALGALMNKKRLDRGSKKDGGDSEWWLFLTGLFYLLLTSYYSRTAPDARFFLPGLPFMLLPISEWAVRLVRPKIMLVLATAVALMQSGYVLQKAYRLRAISPDLTSGIAFLAAHPPTPPLVFMYPEGNYRLFPVPHTWYLGYRLRDFWRSDNEQRLRMLQKNKVGGIVIKKYLIGDVDENITNLGIYPHFFVADIAKDSRFAKVYENSEILIFLVPAPVQ